MIAEPSNQLMTSSQSVATSLPKKRRRLSSHIGDNDHDDEKCRGLKMTTNILPRNFVEHKHPLLPEIISDTGSLSGGEDADSGFYEDNLKRHNGRLNENEKIEELILLSETDKENRRSFQTKKLGFELAKTSDILQVHSTSVCPIRKKPSFPPRNRFPKISHKRELSIESCDYSTASSNTNHTSVHAEFLKKPLLLHFDDYCNGLVDEAKKKSD